MCHFNQGAVGHYATWESAVDGFGHIKDTINQRKQLYPERLPPAKHKLPKRCVTRMKINYWKICKNTRTLKVKYKHACSETLIFATIIMQTRNDATRVKDPIEFYKNSLRLLHQSHGLILCVTNGCKTSKLAKIFLKLPMKEDFTAFCLIYSVYCSLDM